MTRWLETWWQGLGQRLQALQARLSLPEAPEAVTAIAGELWRLALESAEANARGVLAAEHAALREAQTQLQAEREAFALEVSSLRTEVDAAINAERVASAQAAELKRLAIQLEAQLSELALQRDAALARAADTESARQATESRLQDLQDAAQSEREALGTHVRAVEDRAHAEVDRARQEGRELRNQLSALQKKHAAVEKSHLRAVEQSTAKTSEAQRQAEIQRARADALEQQLAKLQDLPAVLEAVVRGGAPTSPGRKPATKKGVRASRSRAKVPITGVQQPS